MDELFASIAQAPQHPYEGGSVVGQEAMTAWFFRKVGVDVHIRDRYFIVGRIPVILLCLLALSAVLGVIWLVLFVVRIIV